MLRLYTFQVSHYAEKARWALDWKGAPYQEQRLLPGPHLRVTRRLGGAATSVPILLCDAEVVQGSSAIIDFADRRWPDRPLTAVPDAEREQAAELEAWLDRELGQPLRRVFYFHALPARDLVLHLFTQQGPWWGRLFYGLGYRLVANAIRRVYAIDADTATQDRQRLDAVFARLDQLLDGRRYLIGNGFSRADLTLAALAAPLWHPPEHSTQWPPDDIYPAPLLALRAELGRSRAREHVLRMYRDHRRDSRLPRPVR
jgi:glutathione S-transferase